MRGRAEEGDRGDVDGEGEGQKIRDGDDLHKTGTVVLRHACRRRVDTVKRLLLLPSSSLLGSYLVIHSSSSCSAAATPLAVMLRHALRRSATRALNHSPIPILSVAPTTVRFQGTNGPDAPQHQLVALQMVQYALGHARSQKSEESYDQALLILKQGLSNLRGGGGDDSADDAVGVILLAMSTLHYRRGKLQEAVEKLQMVRKLQHTSLPVRVAAWEGLVGLNLEAGEDVSSLDLSDDSFQLLRNSLEVEGGVSAPEFLSSRVKAIQGLTNLVLGDLKSAEMFFRGCQDCSNDEGNVTLSHGEFLHCTGEFSLAKDLYEKALQAYETKDTSGISYLAAANMVPEEVFLGATCALGQLLSHLRNFHDAEELLTRALNKAEDLFGSTHPKVGVILTCIALMFGHKAKLEGSSSLLIQEGLYRKAIDLLKAPAVDSEVSDMQVDRRDIVALARGGYAELLCIQQKRKGEGEQMRNWAESVWRNRRLSLAQVLDFSEPAKAAVVDTRICRVL